MDILSDRRPQTIEALIDAFGGAARFAEAIALKGASTASEMKRAGSIRVAYWPRIVTEAAARAIPGVTLETIALMQLASDKAREDRAEKVA